MSSATYAINAKTLPSLVSVSVPRKSTIHAKQVAASASSVKVARILRYLAHRWDMYAVLTLMGSASTYGVWTLSHLAG